MTQFSAGWRISDHRPPRCCRSRPPLGRGSASTNCRPRWATPCQRFCDIALAVKAGLLVDDDSELRFRHDLVREAIETSVTPSALAALHLHIARTIAATGTPAVRVATHYALGTQPGDRSTVSSLRAAAREIVTKAPSAAADLLDRALALTDVSDIERDLLIAELVDAAAFWSGQVERAAELGNKALARPLAAPVAAGSPRQSHASRSSSGAPTRR